MTATQVAKKLQVDASTVLRWADDGLLPSISLPSGRRRFRIEDIDRILSGESEPPSAAAS